MKSTRFIRRPFHEKRVFKESWIISITSDLKLDVQLHFRTKSATWLRYFTWSQSPFSVDGIAEIPKYFSSFNLLFASKATMFLFLRQYISYL